MTKLSLPKAAESNPPRRNITRLIELFLAWKAVLLLVAVVSPGPGYDTSTAVYFDFARSLPSSTLTRALETLVLRLTRWDAIYFTSIAERGYLFEQEWAFGGAWGRLPSFFVPVLSPLALSPIIAHALVACCLSHLFHLFAVLLLFNMASNLVPSGKPHSHSVAFTAACLHIVSPAGLFLSAPNNESAFAFWSFAGIAVYTSWIRRNGSHSSQTSWPIWSGILLGCAAATRGNGILNGVFPAWDFIHLLLTTPWRIVTLFRPGFTVILSGILIAIGFAAPQFMAYMHYCLPSAASSSSSAAVVIRPWCSRLPPSIYQWVQEEYWDVGFLRYWKGANVPLFGLAAPMLVLLIYTACTTLVYPEELAILIILEPKKSEKNDTLSTTELQAKETRAAERQVLTHLLPRFALPQLLIAVLATTSFHVQIINRLAAAYPLWYILLAVAVERPLTLGGTRGKNEGEDEVGVLRWLRTGNHAKWVVQAMVVYAVVQGGLYASFLPPA